MLLHAAIVFLGTLSSVVAQTTISPSWANSASFRTGNFVHYSGMIVVNSQSGGYYFQHFSVIYPTIMSGSTSREVVLGLATMEFFLVNTDFELYIENTYSSQSSFEFSV